MHEEMTIVMCAYTNVDRSIERYLSSEDDTHYHYDTYSFIKENLWLEKVKECLIIVENHRRLGHTKVSP